jgi:hypothetical protein
VSRVAKVILWRTDHVCPQFGALGGTAWLWSNRNRFFFLIQLILFFLNILTRLSNCNVLAGQQDAHKIVPKKRKYVKLKEWRIRFLVYRV